MVGTTSPEYDVIVIGAGISGINAAYRVQKQMPGCKYAILEARDVLGGTWSLFKYPGIRSDSDLFTFGFAWRPWTGMTRFASGQEISTYLQEAAQEQGIDKKIKYNHKVTKLAFSTAKALWTISVDNNGKEKTITTKFLIMGTGYYNYNEPLKADIAGIENFQGRVVHPQFWPEDLDYAGKKVVIIGSGATAVTLLPNMAKTAAHVTMLQRSPSYVMVLPNQAKRLPQWVPSPIRFAFNYFRYLIMPFLFYRFCITFPTLAKKMIRKVTSKELPETIPHDPHFNPSYNPWQQRLCMSPDGDFFESLRDGKANVVTGTIEDVQSKAIILKSGEKVEADIIVSATGLKLQFGGGAEVLVDGKPIKTNDKFIWRGIMMQDVPNCAFVIGYTNASWTLGADCTALVVCRLLKNLERQKAGYVVASTKGYDLQEKNILNLSSTYITVNRQELPKAGDVGPWKARVNYFRDYWTANFGDLSKGLVYV